MGNLMGGGFFIFLLLCFFGFIFFCIYFIFKQMQFVIQAINLYKDMVTRQDAMIKILKDIRGANSLQSANSVVKNQFTDDIEVSQSINYQNIESEKLKKLIQNYENLKQQIISEIAGSLSSKEETKILDSLSKLSYTKLLNMNNNSASFSETQLKVFNLLFKTAEKYLFSSPS